MKKYYEIYNYMYDDTHSFGFTTKTSRENNIGFVFDTEENVKELNEKRGFFTKYPEDTITLDQDLDYISYRQINISTFDDIKSKVPNLRFGTKEENKIDKLTNMIALVASDDEACNEIFKQLMDM